MSSVKLIESNPVATNGEPGSIAPLREPVFWRVEGSLLNLTAVRPVGFFTWNAQTFLRALGAPREHGRAGACAAAPLRDEPRCSPRACCIPFCAE